VTRARVEPPAAVAAPAVPLGTLAPALRRLAALQGSWPPRPPAHVRRVDPDAPAGAPSAARLGGLRDADAAADEGVDLLVVESAAAPAPALAAVAVLLGLEPVGAVGTSGGPGWAGRVTAVRDRAGAARDHAADPDAPLDALGDPVLGLVAGLLHGSAVRRTPVLLGSGVAAVAALLLADRRARGVATWALAGCSSAVPGAARALAALRLEPVLDLRLPGPGGALLAERLLLAALELLPEAEPADDDGLPGA
jgi:nicotinate-nucleotide--dimethylbenzimidazole phosphoribosyltransferase